LIQEVSAIAQGDGHLVVFIGDNTLRPEGVLPGRIVRPADRADDLEVLVQGSGPQKIETKRRIREDLDAPASHTEISPLSGLKGLGMGFDLENNGQVSIGR